MNHKSRIFATATPYIETCRVSFKQFCLNTPGGAGSYLFGRSQCGVAASPSGLFILTKLRRHMQDFIETQEGIRVLIDTEDHPKLSRYKWKVKREGSRQYAVCAKPPFTRMHRMVLQPKRGEIIDHANGDGLDNRKCNLRICTPSQNMYNRKVNRNNITGFKGVSIDKKTGLFLAAIQKDRKSIKLGLFDNPFKAAKAYDAAAKEMFGEFANLNFGDNAATKKK